MWYVIYSEDVENSLPLRKKTRAAHLERIQVLADQGRVLVAGPCPAIDSEDPGEAGFTGSVVIIDFPSLEEAKEWADTDPYALAGVYSKVVVKPYKVVLP
ncbi:YciI family protein [uncultured Paraglaciecola sp.]|uniref:YciI family protein n=1 Tax=uncultured Paraglaciecola sp. TaxID=1765024 RepID=UPI002593629D|nr:YciI family protein [uncultured Paraglaciecola sp.]